MKNDESKQVAKLFRNSADDRHWHWYSEKDKTWYYAALYKGRWEVNVTKPEYGHYAEFGYYKDFGVGVDNEGTFLAVGDEVAVAYKSGAQKSVRRGKIMKITPKYSFVTVLGEEHLGPQKFAPQSLLKLSGSTPKKVIEEKNTDSSWFCEKFPNCSLNCNGCDCKIKIDYEELDKEIQADVQAEFAKRGLN